MPRDMSKTIFHPGRKIQHSPGSKRDTRITHTLPSDLRQQAVVRLRLTALVYSAAYFFADVVPSIAAGEMAERLKHPILWIPTAASILMGLLVAAATSIRLSWRLWTYIGLGFEVLATLGIAITMYYPGPVMNHLGPLPNPNPSWPAIWFIIYSIVVPAPPRLGLAAAVLSGAMAPIILWIHLQAMGGTSVLSNMQFFFAVVVPHAVCVGLASAGGYIVYRLGRDVSRARELGSYRLGERLGAGGMGEVWKASHLMLARPAAIKFIRPETIAGTNAAECEAVLKRFEREAQATAALTSSHTVDVYDFGVTDDGTFYYVMELLDGLDLENLVRSFGPLTPARVTYLLAQAGEALEEAHGKGLIHRDVKPANIYACRNGVRHDFVKMLDFGLVAQTRAGSGWETRLTVEGRATGTPAYMPPEIARGGPVDGRTDLYALACVAYWLLTGRTVFKGPSIYEVVSQHLQMVPDPPSRYAAHPVPRELDQVILDCLEKNPDRRPPDARTVGQRLRAIAFSEPWKDEDADRWWASHLPPGAPIPIREAETSSVESSDLGSLGVG